ncbi:MAG: hypothetical protein K2G31_06045 [Clostridia bacterium]|nr:hypothetical protein [Clostridia bacterium]
MKDGQMKYARMTAFTNRRIRAIIDEIIKRSNGAIEDMRGKDDIIDLWKNPNILIK